MNDNVLKLFFHSVDKNAAEVCFHFKEGGRWQTLKWKEAGDLVCRLGKGLSSIGVTKGSRVGIISQSRLEWTLADLAIMSLGAVTVPIYPSLPPDRAAHILKDANITHVFVENQTLKKKIEEAASHIQNKPMVINIEDTKEGAHSFKNLVSLGAGYKTGLVRQNINGIDTNDIATIIYTSGTTGVPKGVVLSHSNIAYEVGATRQIFNFKQSQIGLLCLPLSHVLGRLMQFHQLAQGYQLAFIESYEKVAENCRDVRPYFIVGVPRMIEKMHERIMRRLNSSGALKRKLFNWAINAGMERGPLIQKHRPIPAFLSLKYAVARSLVFKKFAKLLGGRLRLFICGGAPLSKDLGRFFHAMDLLIIEGYGLTETFAAVTVNRIDDFHFGTVGKPLPGIELALSPENEILVRGPTVFRGYLNLPEETSSVKTSDGWFLTGDIGELSRDGFLRITDRKKDIIVTSGGENVAPQMIESYLMESRFINHCMVYGDKKKYLTALITLNPEAVGEYARKMGIENSPEIISSHPKIHELIDSVVKDKNRQLARHETIKKFIILKNDFSQETGELTPTLKVCRKFTAEKYKDILESLYRE